MRMSKRSPMVAAVLTGLALSVAACGEPVQSQGFESGGPQPGPSQITSPTPASADGGDSGGSGGGGSTRCHSGDLTISAAPDADGGGAAGHVGEALVFTNKSDATCTLQGFPGVSFVTGDDGEQVGSAFARIEEDTPKPVGLEPGEDVHATILLANTGNFDAADCKPVDVRGFRVYPPDETAAIFVAESHTACSAEGVGVGQVQAIVEG